MSDFSIEWGVYMLKNAARHPQWADAYHHDIYMQAMYILAIEAN
jgi:hypothetical protein